MFSTIMLLLTAVLAVFTSAASNSDFLPFQITNLTITKVAGANVTMLFTVTDPDPLGKATQSCGGTWVAGSKAYPTGGYAACGNSTFGWNMQSYTTMENFVLGLEHSYEDPSVGQPPYDVITNFAKANMTLANHPCKTKNGQKVCAQQAGTTIKAPIWGSEA